MCMYSSEGGDVKGVASFTDDDDDLLSIHAKPQKAQCPHPHIIVIGIVRFA